MIDFTRIDYLQTGNPRQQLAYRDLQRLRLFELLSAYDPLLAGTIPIDIDLSGSDLDIICYCSDHLSFSRQITAAFKNESSFHIHTITINDIPTTIATFQSPHFPIEIFGQNIPSREQAAYRHMLIEYALLQQKGEAFRKQIIHLKHQGLKTEPAFAQLLGLTGDPYSELLHLNTD